MPRGYSTIPDWFSFENQGAGVAVAGVADGVGEAMAVVRATRPDAVLTDLYLRDGSGIELVKRVVEVWSPSTGEYDVEDNPLKNAPHTAEMLIAGEWKHHYRQEEAAYPAGVDRRAKYWPPVRRIDQAYGDRNLVCACPPPEAYTA